MTAAIWNITLEQGATFEKTLLWADSSVNPPTPINLTGYTARMQVRRYAGAPDADKVVDIASGSGITLGGAAGTIAISIPSATTAAIPAGFQGVYDLELVSGTGKVTRLVQGSVAVSPEVTV
jgi:hypothetical protein